MKTIRKTIATAIIAATTSTTAMASAEPRIPNNGCTTYTVKKGDTAWSIANKNNLTVPQLGFINPHITKLDYIYPGDQFNIDCTQTQAPSKAETKIEAGQPVFKPNKLEAKPTQQNETLVQWRETTEPCFNGDTCYTWPAILIALHDAGFRGNDLITMAAIVPGESNRRITAVGDNTQEYLVNGWGPSVTIFQIRTRVEETGTGSTRDITKLSSSLADASQAAFALYQQYLSYEKKGWVNKVTKKQYTRFDAWTCFILGNHENWVNPVRVMALEIGVVE